MTSEILFGECFELIEEFGDWKKVRLLHDRYEGWIESKDKFPNWDYKNLGVIVECTYLNGHYLSIGSYVDNVTDHSLPANQSLSISELPEAALKFLNTPYLWGGRTVWGIDCSGFTQIIARLGGQNIPRDAYQQAEIGQNVLLESAKAMDLAFFKNEKGKITHVGFVLPHQRIIHASEKVRIDHLDKKGILRESLSEYTHRLSHIRRIF